MRSLVHLWRPFPRVTARNIYRDNYHYNPLLIATIPNNTATSFTDNVGTPIGTVNQYYVPNTTNNFITQNGVPALVINSWQTAFGKGAIRRGL